VGRMEVKKGWRNGCLKTEIQRTHNKNVIITIHKRMGYGRKRAEGLGVTCSKTRNKEIITDRCCAQLCTRYAMAMHGASCQKSGFGTDISPQPEVVSTKLCRRDGGFVATRWENPGG
jgi:hypothetical protein